MGKACTDERKLRAPTAAVNRRDLSSGPFRRPAVPVGRS